MKEHYAFGNWYSKPESLFYQQIILIVHWLQSIHDWVSDAVNSQTAALQHMSGIKYNLRRLVNVRENLLFQQGINNGQ